MVQVQPRSCRSSSCGFYHLLITISSVNIPSGSTCAWSSSRQQTCVHYYCLFFFVFFFKEYEAIYLAKLTIKMMSPMQLGRSFSLQAGVAGLSESPPAPQLQPLQFTGACVIPDSSPVHPPRTHTSVRSFPDNFHLHFYFHLFTTQLNGVIKEALEWSPHHHHPFVHPLFVCSVVFKSFLHDHCWVTLVTGLVRFVVPVLEICPYHRWRCAMRGPTVDVKTRVSGPLSGAPSTFTFYFHFFQEAEKGAWKRTRTSERCRSQQRRTDELCWYLAAWRSALWLFFFFFFYIFNGIKNVNIWTFSMGRGTCVGAGPLLSETWRNRGTNKIWNLFFWSWMHWREIFLQFYNI